MNNNRQQNGRRRGRGSQRQGGGGNQGNGSRIDNRARGNAAQLLEKYKTLAADAQRQGDRVNTEYYLQFADHYFRVVSEQRGRFEEQDRQRRETQGHADSGQFDDQFDGDDFDGDDQPDGRDSQPRDREASRDGNRDASRDGNRDGSRDASRDQRRGDGERGNRERPRRERGDAAPALPDGASLASEGEHAADGEQQEARPRRARVPRREAAPAAAGDTFDGDRLPPSFAPANDGDEAPDADAKPRRRRLRPAGEATQAG